MDSPMLQPIPTIALSILLVVPLILGELVGNLPFALHDVRLAVYVALRSNIRIGFAAVAFGSTLFLATL